MKAERKSAGAQVLIEQAWCKGCGICVDLCPKGALDLDPQGYAVWARPDDCVACGLCELRCPDLAVQLVKREEQS